MSKKRQDWAKFMQRMEDAYKNDHRQLWQLVQRLVPSGKKASVVPVRGKDGTLARSEEQILEVWAEHQEFLGTPKAHELQDTDFAERVSKQVNDCMWLSRAIPDGLMDGEFTDEDIEEGVEALGYHKAQAEDGTSAVARRCGFTLDPSSTTCGCGR